MKKIVSTIIVILLLLTNLQVVSASNIGMRQTVLEPDYIDFDATLPMQKGKDLGSDWNLNLSGKYEVSPSLYLSLSDTFQKSTTIITFPASSNGTTLKTETTQNSLSFDAIYLLGDNLLFDLELGLTNSVRYSSTSTSANPNPTATKSTSTSFTYGLVTEYIFLNMPTYQVGASAAVSNKRVYLELMGGYDISPSLVLQGSSRISFNYSNNTLDLMSRIFLYYKKDLLKATLSYVTYDMTNQTTTPSLNDSLSLSLSSRLPLGRNFIAALSGFFSILNLKATPYCDFGISAGAEYMITKDFSLGLSYRLDQNRSSSTNSSGTTVSYSYTHRISLGAKYTF